MDTFIRFYSKVLLGDDCWLWQGARGGSLRYGMFSMGSRTDGTKRAHFAHRVSWELWNGPIPPGQLVLHRCDVPTCVRPDHLFLGSQQDNLADARSKGRLINAADGRFAGNV